jgi:hypothetical protein
MTMTDKKLPRRSGSQGKQAKDTHWPPSEEDWRDLLRELPDTADRRAVQIEIKAAVRGYVERTQHDDVQHSLRKKVEEAVPTALAKLSPLKQLAALSRDEFNAIYRQIEALPQSLTPEQLNAAAYLPRERRERLLTRLLHALIGPGRLRFAHSDDTPLARTLSLIMDYVPSGPLSARGAREFFERYFDRWCLLRATLGGRINLSIDESKIFLIDP